MRLRGLRATGWRNLAPLTFRPEARVSVLSGDNGQGKTNVLEALHYLATLRSFRTTDAANLIRHGAPAAKLAAEAEVGGLERRIEVSLEVGQRKVLLDG